MFTNNYWAALTNMFGPNNSYYRNGVSTIGSDASLSHLRSMQSMKIGTGNTPAKKSDYVLEAPIDESLYTVAFVDNFSSDISSDEAYLSLQATFTNKAIVHSQSLKLEYLLLHTQMLMYFSLQEKYWIHLLVLHLEKLRHLF